MWSYIKGLSIGAFLLWLIFTICLAINSGVIIGVYYSITFVRAILTHFLVATKVFGYIGIFALLAIFCLAWVFAMGEDDKVVTVVEEILE